MGRPRLAMVSEEIRGDLIEPLRWVTRVELLHFYRRASYGDLDPEALADPSLRRYRGPADLLRALARARPDLLQGVDPFALRLMPILYTVFAVSRILGRPLLLVTLENRPLPIKYGQGARLLRPLLRPVFRWARRIVVLNEGARANVRWIGPFEGKTERRMYGTWGVDPERFTPERDGREPDFGPGPVLLFVGRLVEEKGVRDLMQAFPRVRARFPQACLVLIGAGPLRAELEAFSRRPPWAGAVRMLGPVRHRELPPYFRAADLVISPSRTTRKWAEQVGMVNLQAMACGVPVIATRSGAIPEYVPDGVAGRLVPEGDPEALAEVILSLLEDGALRQRLGRQGRIYALAHYDARQHVAAAEALWLALASPEAMP